MSHAFFFGLFDRHPRCGCLFFVAAALVIASSTMAQDSDSRKESPASIVTVRLAYHEPPSSEKPVQVEVIAEEASTSSDLATEATLPGAVRLQLRRNVAWYVRVRGDGVWAPEAVVVPSREQEVVSLDVWRTGTLLLEVEPPDAQPETLKAYFRPSPGEKAEFSETVTTCVHDEEAWKCDLPAGRLDVRVKARGSASFHLWDLDVLPAVKRAVGPFRLQKGASVIGWVEAGGKDGSVESATVRLVPLSARPLPGGAEARQKLRGEATKPNERGFFQFEGVLPGDYEILATHPAYLETRQGPISVFEDAETELTEPLMFLEPETITLYMEPSVQPGDKPWWVHVYAVAEGRGTRSLGRTQAGLDGSWHSQKLAPGRYSLHVESEDSTTWHEETVVLQNYPVSRAVSIPIVRFTATVKLGEDPLKAEVTLRREGEIFKFQSNEAGRFDGIIRDERAWDARVFSREPWVRRWVRNVPLRERPGGRGARMEIELPDTRITGRVVDEDYQPVDRAAVRAVVLGQDGIRTVPVDEDGEFDLVALDPGTVRLSAVAAGDRSSDEVTLQVSNGIDLPEVTLVVREMFTVRGRVVAERGRGTPEVHMKAWPRDRPLSPVAPVRTDLEGWFELRLPKATREIALTVFPRGYALRMTTQPVSRNEPLIIPISQVSGTLALEFSEAPERDYRSGVAYILMRDGVWIGLDSLMQWTGISGAGASPESTRIVVPRLEPGDYAFCAVRTEQLWTLSAAGPAALPDSCVTGYVPPLGEVTLDVPDVEPGEEGSRASP